MAGSVTKKVPSKALKGVIPGQINVAKDGDTVKLWTVLGGKVYELAMVAQTSAPASGGSGGTTDHGALSGLSDDDHTQYVLNTGDTIAGAVMVDGSADAVQLKAQGHSTQTANIFEIEDSGANDQVTIDANGAAVFNEEGNAANFRVESDTDANCLHVNGTNNTVQVGASSASDSAKLYVAGKISASGEVEINGDLNHDGDNAGFCGAAPTPKRTAYTQTYSTATRTHSNPTATALTDSTGGTANDTLVDVTTLLVADPAKVNDNFADVVARINALIVDVANAKQVLNQFLDDIQEKGLIQ